MLRKLNKVAPWVFIVALAAFGLLMAGRGETAREIWLSSPATGIGTDTTTMVAPNGYYFGSFRVMAKGVNATVVTQPWATTVDASFDGTNYNLIGNFSDAWAASAASYCDTLASADVGAVRALRFRTTVNDSCTLKFQVSVLKAGD